MHNSCKTLKKFYIQQKIHDNTCKTLKIQQKYTYTHKIDKQNLQIIYQW